MRIATSAAVVLLLAGCAAGTTDQSQDALRNDVNAAKDASVASQHAAEAASQSASQSAEAAQQAAKAAEDAARRAEAIYNRSLTKSGGRAASR